MAYWGGFLFSKGAFQQGNEMHLYVFDEHRNCDDEIIDAATARQNSIPMNDECKDCLGRRDM